MSGCASLVMLLSPLMNMDAPPSSAADRIIMRTSPPNLPVISLSTVSPKRSMPASAFAV